MVEEDDENCLRLQQGEADLAKVVHHSVREREAENETEVSLTALQMEGGIEEATRLQMGF